MLSYCSHPPAPTTHSSRCPPTPCCGRPPVSCCLTVAAYGMRSYVDYWLSVCCLHVVLCAVLWCAWVSIGVHGSALFCVYSSKSRVFVGAACSISMCCSSQPNRLGLLTVESRSRYTCHTTTTGHTITTGHTTVHLPGSHLCTQHFHAACTLMLNHDARC